MKKLEIKSYILLVNFFLVINLDYTQNQVYFRGPQNCININRERYL